ncbi:hypothetical protein GV054_09120 [Marinomonas mediterranea]|uniref:head maturation protease, ClpP-related n=1 Tax=Marinomonas mediterranea TaxID=119864 RepID=UPI00234A65C8|nr:head maturation protease, ClpP-related [Marinomonas mediterranea]WCN13155.1 hypothetical protein GV054_09120 [Marinomonas mediterranea]
MKWYEILNLTGGAGDKPRSVTINIHGTVGGSFFDPDAVAASEFIQAVQSMGDLDEIRVSLATPGGNFFDGLAIANFLKGHKAEVIIEILSEASSAGSAIAMGASAGKLRAYPASFMMIHNPLTGMQGNANDFRAMADKLDILKSGLLRLYAERTGIEGATLWEMLDQETLMTAEEAVLKGFVDEIIVTEAPVLNCNLASREQVKSEVLNSLKGAVSTQNSPPVNGSDNDAVQIIKMCHDKNLSFLASDFVTQNLSITDVQSRLTTANDIQNICATAGLNTVTQNLIQNMNNPAELLRIAVSETKAEMDEDIDSGGPKDLTQNKQNNENIKNSWSRAISAVKR